MPRAKSGAKPIQLDFRSIEQVIVVPDDKDRFATTQREAARACQIAEVGKEWAEEFEGFLSRIHHWCHDHKETIESGYVDIGDGGLRVSICTKDSDYEFAFEDTVTELDIELAKIFPRCTAEVTQIPNQKALKDELSSETAILVYGHRAGSQKAGTP